MMNGDTAMRHYSLKHSSPALAVALVACAMGGCHFKAGNPPRMKSAHDEAKRATEERLHVEARLSGGTFRLDRASSAKIYESFMRWDEANMKRVFRFQSDGKTGRLEAAIDAESVVDETVKMDLSLSGEIPLSIKVETGVGENVLDLTGMKVESLSLNSGVGETKIDIEDTQESDCKDMEVHCGVGEVRMTGLSNLAPSRLRFNGGVGSAVLDFSGEGARDMRADVESGVGGVEVYIPSALGVRIESNTGLGGISLPGSRFEEEGGTYTSQGYSQAKQKLVLNIRQGVGGITVRVKD